MEFEKAMRQAAEFGLIFNEAYMDQKLPQGVWICDNVAEISDIQLNAVCLGSGVDFDAIAKCQPFFQLFEYVVIVTPNAIAREKLVKEIFPRLPACVVYVINDSGFKNCKMNEFYNRHYITTRADGAITGAWSDGPHPEKDTTNAVCINDKGGYQLRFYPDGEENPPLYDMDGIPLYKWDGSQVVERTEEEIEADRAAIPEPPPSPQERLRADVDFIAAMTGVML